MGPASCGNSRCVRIVGESAAGRPFARRVALGEAVRISTGAELPLGSDAVIRREGAAAFDGVLAAPGVAPGRDVRQAGEDYSCSDTVLAGGHRVRAHDVGVIASCGWDGAFCRRQPRVVVVSTGDELVSPGQVPDSGRVVDSNRLAIAAAVQAAGGLVEWTRWVLMTLPTSKARLSTGLGRRSTCWSRAVARRWAITTILAPHCGPWAGVAWSTASRCGRAVRRRWSCWVRRACWCSQAHRRRRSSRFTCSDAPCWAARSGQRHRSPFECRSARAVDEFVRCRATPDGLVPLAAQGSTSMAGLAGAHALAWIALGALVRCRRRRCAGQLPPITLLGGAMPDRRPVATSGRRRSRRRSPVPRGLG